MNLRMLDAVLAGEPPVHPEKFEPGVFSDIYHQHAHLSFSPHGDTVFWSVWTKPREGTETLLFVERHEGEWSRSQTAPFSGLFFDHGPNFADHGDTLIFSSRRPASAIRGSGEEDDRRIRLWKTHRTDGGWSSPSLLEIPNPEARPQTMPSIAADGTLYFLMARPVPHGQPLRGEICRSRLIDGVYQDPEPLPASINCPDTLNWTPFITLDEEFLFFSSHREGGSPNGDIYVSQRDVNGDWMDPVNVGSPINTNQQERFPGVSPDGKTFFFTRGADMYWVSSSVLRLKAHKHR